MMANNAEIDEVLIPLMDAFPKWQPGSMSSTLDQYHRALGKYPKDLLQRAADRCLDSCLDFPKIAEIIKAVVTIRDQEIKNKPDNMQKYIKPDAAGLARIGRIIDAFREKQIRSGKWNLSEKAIKSPARQWSDEEIELILKGEEKPIAALPHLKDVEARLPYKDD